MSLPAGPPEAMAAAADAPAWPRVVVSDAGPLISLGRLDLLKLLPALFSRVQVPEAVIGECLARPGNNDAQRIHLAVDSGWLLPCTANDLDLPGLDLGERAAISRALALRADLPAGHQVALLADDQAARQRAKALGLAVMGTLGVLVLSKRGGLVDAVAPLIETLRAGGQRLSHEAVMQVLRAAGEAGS